MQLVKSNTREANKIERASWHALIFFLCLGAFFSYALEIPLAKEPPSASDEMKLCEEAYNSKHWEDAAKWCSIAARQGNVDAQTKLGWMYLGGQGVPLNPGKAVKWFRKAAEQGDIGAQWFLGLLYLAGGVVPQDYGQAVKWFRKAAEKGHTDAQFNLGVIYHDGQGVPQDYTEALKWFRKAAEKGHTEAQFALGLMYLEGQGVRQDYTEALNWLRKAAEQGHAGAQYNLGVMYASGNGVMVSGVAAADWYYKAGVAFLKEDKKDMALTCVERIQGLKNVLHLEVPNYFLAERLLQRIYGKGSGPSAPISEKPETSFGTAWPVSTGFAVTAFHVTRGHDKFLLVTKAGRKINARLAVSDAANDIALLEVTSPDNLPPAIPIATRQARVGDKVFTIGYPHPGLMGAEPKLTEGIISSLTGISNDPRTYQISVPIQAGNSGGPLLNMKGEAVGIVISKLSAAEMFKRTNDITENVNYSVKIAYLNVLLSALPDKHPLEILPAKRGTLPELAARLEGSVMIVIAQ